MMAALLLVFVLILSVSLYQYFTMLETKTAELDAQKALVSQQQVTLDAQTLQLASQQVTMDKQATEIAIIQVQLDSQAKELENAYIVLSDQQAQLQQAQTDLADREAKLIILQTDLNNKEMALQAANEVLENQQAAMAAQAEQIDALIGIRPRIITALSSALSSANLSATVDNSTGDIVLDSSVLFDTGKSEIRAEGKALLDRFVPVYLNVLLRDEYSAYLGEIIIEGYTDSTGRLLQQPETLARARAVRRHLHPENARPDDPPARFAQERPADHHRARRHGADLRPVRQRGQGSFAPRRVPFQPEGLRND